MATSATEITTHLSIFRGLVDEWTSVQPATQGFVSPAGQVKDGDLKNVVVAFRTRPPLEGEAQDKFHGDEDDKTRETCLGVTPKVAEPGLFVVHVPGKKWSGYTLVHKEYHADLGFGPDVKNEEVYERAVVANKILPLVLSGGIGCILAYGQTSSGKTYTMEGVESCIARDLFDAARVVGRRLAPDVKDPFEVSVTFLELIGKRATDLVAKDGADVNIQEDKIGNVRPRLTTTTVSSPEELQDLITASLSHRRVVATDRNAMSSRSHAVVTIRIKNKTLPYAEEGQLVLVDLAGSERYEDSKGHDKQRMRESRENNESLMNLKACVRAKAKMAAEDGFVHIPWRSNKLTMLLKPLFDIESRQPSCAVIIAHVSPHIQDSVHSANTLSYAAPFLTTSPKPKGLIKYDALDPRTWTTEKTRDFLRIEFEKRVKKENGEDVDIGLDMIKLCPDGYTAKNLGALYTTEFVERCIKARTSSNVSLDDLKNIAVEVIGTLFYLVMSAKTKSRKAVMKSRKGVETEAYGDAPSVDLAEEDKELSASSQVYQEAFEHFMDTWNAERDAFMTHATHEIIDKKSTEFYETQRLAYSKFLRGKIEAWKEIKAQRMSETAESDAP